MSSRDYDAEIKSMMEISQKIGVLISSEQIVQTANNEPFFPEIKWVKSNTTIQEK